MGHGIKSNICIECTMQLELKLFYFLLSQKFCKLKEPKHHDDGSTSQVGLYINLRVVFSISFPIRIHVGAYGCYVNAYVYVTGG